MDVLEGADDAPGVEPRVLLAEAPVLGARDQVEALVHVGPQLTALYNQIKERGGQRRSVTTIDMHIYIHVNVQGGIAYIVIYVLHMYLNELHEHVDAVVVLEGGQQLQHEHVAAVAQNVLLFAKQKEREKRGISGL